MTLQLSALVSVAMALAIPNLAFAEGNSAIPGHPGDISRVATTATSVDPFSFVVPALEREVPMPSYGIGTSSQAADPAVQMDKSMENMDHSNMPGMTEGTN